ncbi:MAG: SPOR domain-containing protein [bacterium]
MSWFTSLSLRLFLGAAGGLGFSLFLSRYLLSKVSGAGYPVLPILVMILPLLLALTIFIIIPEWIIRHRWERKWLPGANGVREILPEKRLAFIQAGLRELTGPWTFPQMARNHTRLFTTGWAKTLLRLRARDVWTWELYALSWYALKDDEDAVDELRGLLMESRTLEDAAFDVGLSVLDVRQADVDLAILLSHEGLVREFSRLNPERRVLLENVWLAAYARDEASRGELLPHLTKLFLQQQRRDEVSGRIYLDAFIAGIRSPDLRMEMRRVAAVLARTGRSPEMTANLRALAGSGNGHEPPQEAGVEVDTGTILRAPTAWSEFKSAFPKDADLTQEVPDSKTAGKGRIRISKSVAKETEAVVGLREQAGKRKSWKRERTKALGVGSSIRVWVAIVLVVVLTATGAAVAWYFATTREKPPQLEPATVSKPVSTRGVESELPFTIQVAALPQRGAAFDRVRTLRLQGLDAYYVITQRGDASWYRVRFGHFETTRAAQAVADSLRELGIINEYFVATFEQGVVPPDRSR